MRCEGKARETGEAGEEEGKDTRWRVNGLLGGWIFQFNFDGFVGTCQKEDAIAVAGEILASDGIVGKAVAFGGDALGVAVDDAIAVQILKDSDRVATGCNVLERDFEWVFSRFFSDFDASTDDSVFVMIRKSIASGKQLETEFAFLIFQTSNFNGQCAFKFGFGALYKN